MHSKRIAASKLWPIPRKGNKFIVVANNNKTNGIPVLVAMRDVLGYVKTRKELKKILLEGKIEVNGIKIKDEGHSLVLFDILGLPTIKKYYRISLSPTKKIAFEEVKDKDSKIIKIINKKTLPGNKTQLNLRDGRNIISKEKVNTGDSIIFNLKDKKIEKVLPIKEKSEVLVIKGKHLGSKGKIKKISENKINVSLEEGEFNLNKDAIMALS